MRYTVFFNSVYIFYVSNLLRPFTFVNENNLYIVFICVYKLIVKSNIKENIIALTNSKINVHP